MLISLLGEVVQGGAWGRERRSVSPVLRWPIPPRGRRRCEDGAQRKILLTRNLLGSEPGTLLHAGRECWRWCGLQP